MKNTKSSTVVTNKKFAETDQTFIAAYERAGIKVTTRQASKYRNGKGKAIRFK